MRCTILVKLVFKWGNCEFFICRWRGHALGVTAGFNMKCLLISSVCLLWINARLDLVSKSENVDRIRLEMLFVYGGFAPRVKPFPSCNTHIVRSLEYVVFRLGEKTRSFYCNATLWLTFFNVWRQFRVLFRWNLCLSIEFILRHKLGQRVYF